MTTVFISYRRGETAGEARALFKELVETLGKDSVFMDVDTIALGRDFRQAIGERLQSCDLMLALVGRDWADSKNTSGLRRLDDPADFVRMEIEAALKRDIPVTPVLVQGAHMPGVGQLPEEIRDFAFRNGFELSYNRWESDIREMFKRLGLSKQADTGASHNMEAPGRKTPAESSSTPARGAATGVPGERSPTRMLLLTTVGASVVAIALTGGGILYYRLVTEKNAEIEQALMESLKAKADAEAAARAEEERAAAQAERDRAQAKAAAQAERRRIAEAEDEKKQLAAAQAERARVAAQAAEAERARVAEAEEQSKRQAADRQQSAARTLKFSGSMTVSMGAYARSAGLTQSELTTKNTMGACAKWSQELPLDVLEGQSFRASCMSLADFANANGWQLGAKPTPQDSMKFCLHVGNQLTGDVRRTFFSTCLKYR